MQTLKYYIQLVLSISILNLIKLLLFPDPAYRRASNFYLLIKDILLDIRGQCTVKMTPRGFNVVKTCQLGKVISLNGRDESIQIQTREQSCITNPDLCSNGLSIGFWLLMKGGKYIMSAGTYGGELQ